MNFRVSPQSRAVKLFFFLIVLKFIVLIFFNESKIKRKNKYNIFPAAQSYERRDWHDWQFVEYEKTRKGFGEQGEAVMLTDLSEIELSKNLSQLEGLSPVVSDKISVNRSLADCRLPV